jgi:hypothetical protein
VTPYKQKTFFKENKNRVIGDDAKPTGFISPYNSTLARHNSKTTTQPATINSNNKSTAAPGLPCVLLSRVIQLNCCLLYTLSLQLRVSLIKVDARVSLIKVDAFEIITQAYSTRVNSLPR